MTLFFFNLFNLLSLLIWCAKALTSIKGNPIPFSKPNVNYKNYKRVVHWDIIVQLCKKNPMLLIGK